MKENEWTKRKEYVNENKEKEKWNKEKERKKKWKKKRCKNKNNETGFMSRGGEIRIY